MARNNMSMDLELRLEDLKIVVQIGSSATLISEDIEIAVP